MAFALFQTILLSVSSTLHWAGFYSGIQRLKGRAAKRWRWMIGSAIFCLLWLMAVVLLASNDFFRAGAFPPKIPSTLLLTLLVGHLFLLSGTFRRIIAGIPQHWLIAVQIFRVIGFLFLIRYFEGALPALFALPAGIGDVLTGVLAPFVAYWLYAGKPYARRVAIAWNVFGILDLVNAVALGIMTGGGGGGIVFPIVLIPVYGVPRAILLHSYSLYGLTRGEAVLPVAEAARA